MYWYLYPLLMTVACATGCLGTKKGATGGDDPEGPEDDQTGRVREVIDGNSFILEGGRQIDLIGVAAPTSDQRCFDGAREDLERLVLGKEVRVESDSEPASGTGEGEGGGGGAPRYVFLLEGAEQFVNELMIRAGNVWLSEDPPIGEYGAILEQAAEETREGGESCAWDQCFWVPEGGIVDGDTFDYINAQGIETRVRMLGINTPERTTNPPEPCAERARSALNVFIAGRWVRLSRDSGADDTDMFDRLLRYVSRCEYEEIGLTNLEILEAGVGCVFIWGDNRLSLEDELRAAQRRASQNRAGCWETNSNFCE